MSEHETFQLNVDDKATLLDFVEINTGPQEAKALSEKGPRPAVFHITEGAECVIIEDFFESVGGCLRPVWVKYYVTDHLTVTFYEMRKNLKKAPNVITNAKEFNLIAIQYKSPAEAENEDAVNSLGQATR